MEHPIFALIILVFMLGMRHGIEPDHLAIIDGMTRCSGNQSSSRYIGFLFSLGHGIVIVFITFLFGITALSWAIPNWFQGLGTFISISSLILIGVYNLYIAFQKSQSFSNPLQNSAADSSLWIRGLYQSPTIRPVLVGMLFSLSFDTLSQTVAYSLSGYELAGWFFPVLLGAVFMTGMMIIDGLNGFLVASFFKQVSKKSLFIPRLLSFLVGGFSLAMAIFYAIK